MKNATLYIVIALFVGGVAGALAVWKFVPPQTVVQQVPTRVQPPLTTTTTVPVTTTPTSATSTTGCHAFTVISPVAKMEAQELPISVRAIVDNRIAGCHWTVFEAQAGGVELRDTSGKVLAQSPLTTTQDWMTDAPVEYDALLEPAADFVGPAVVVITEENPSDKPNPQVVSVHLNLSGYGNSAD